MFRFACLFAVLSLMGQSAPTARAQEEAAAPVPKPPADLNTMEGALTRVVWNARSRGALVIVDPKKQYVRNKDYNPTFDGPMKEPEPLKDSSDGISIRDVARRFELRFVPIGSVTTLAPETTIALNTNPTGGNITSNMRKEQKLRVILASLTPAQWQMLGGESGIGASDLPQDLQETFLSLLPSPIKYRQTSYKEKQDYPTMGEPVTVPDGARRGMRMRIARKLNFMFQMQGREGSYYGTDMSRFDKRPKLQLEQRWDGERENSAFGVPVKTEVPNRLKPSQINWDTDALAVPVALEGVKNIGDIVDRVAQATRADIRADARFRPVPVAYLGDTALARDLLKALCWGTAGAIRRIEGGGRNIYLLTDDVEGLGVRAARLTEWANALQMKLSQQEEILRKKVREAKPKQFLTYRSDDPTAPSPALQERMDAEKKKVGYGMMTLPMNEMPAELATKLKEAAAQINPGDGSKVAPDKVAIQTEYNFSYSVPGVGVLETERYGGGMYMNDWELESVESQQISEETAKYEKKTEENALKPMAANLQTRALLILPKSAEKAKIWVRRAKAVGMTHIYVRLDGSDLDKEILKTAISTGKEVGISVVASVSYLAVKTTTKADAALLPLLDRTILGELPSQVAKRNLAGLSDSEEMRWQKERWQVKDTDWFRSDDAGAAAARARVREIAQTPGLAGLLIRDVSPPGTHDKGESREYYYGGEFNSLEIGYTLENRVEFLNKEGVDPLDIISNGYFNVGQVNFDFPFFRDPQASYEWVEGRGVRKEPTTKPVRLQWQAYRHQKMMESVAGLFADLRQNLPGLPLYIRGVGDNGDEAGWIGSWDKADVLPRWSWISRDGQQAASQEKQAKIYSKTNFVWTQPGFWESKAYPLAKQIRDMRAMLATSKEWNGILFDLTHERAEKGFDLMAEVMRNVSKTPPVARKPAN